MKTRLDKTAEYLHESEIPVVTFDIKRILLPTDGSATSVEATSVAVGLAKKFGAEVVAVFVDPGRIMEPLEQMMEEEAEVVHHSRAGLTVARISGEKNGVIVTDVIKEGAAAAAILRTAAEYDVDLIVIGDTGRTGVRRMVLGSIAEAVLHESHVPVFVVKHGSTAFSLMQRP